MSAEFLKKETLKSVLLLLFSLLLNIQAEISPHYLCIFFTCVQISGQFVTVGVGRLAMFCVTGQTLINFLFLFL